MDPKCIMYSYILPTKVMSLYVFLKTLFNLFEFFKNQKYFQFAFVNYQVLWNFLQRNIERNMTKFS